MKKWYFKAALVTIAYAVTLPETLAATSLKILTSDTLAATLTRWLVDLILVFGGIACLFLLGPKVAALVILILLVCWVLRCAPFCGITAPVGNGVIFFFGAGLNLGMLWIALLKILHHHHR